MAGSAAVLPDGTEIKLGAAQLRLPTSAWTGRGHHGHARAARQPRPGHGGRVTRRVGLSLRPERVRRAGRRCRRRSVGPGRVRG